MRELSRKRLSAAAWPRRHEAAAAGRRKHLAQVGCRLPALAPRISHRSRPRLGLVQSHGLCPNRHHGSTHRTLNTRQRLGLREFCLRHGRDPSNWSKLEREALAPWLWPSLQSCLQSTHFMYSEMPFPATSWDTNSTNWLGGDRCGGCFARTRATAGLRSACSTPASTRSRLTPGSQARKSFTVHTHVRGQPPDIERNPTS